MFTRLPSLGSYTRSILCSKRVVVTNSYIIPSSLRLLSLSSITLSQDQNEIIRNAMEANYPDFVSLAHRFRPPRTYNYLESELFISVVEKCMVEGLRFGRYKGVIDLGKHLIFNKLNPNQVMCKCWMEALTKVGTLKEAIHLQSLVLDRELVDSMDVINGPLKICARDGLSCEVYELMFDFNFKGIVPDLNSYNYVLEATSKDYNFERGLDILKEISRVSKGRCSPDVNSYNVLFKYGKYSSPELVYKTFIEMELNDVEPNLNTFQYVIENLLSKNGIEFAFKVLKKLESSKSYNFKPTPQFYKSIIAPLLTQPEYYKVLEQILVYVEDNLHQDEYDAVTLRNMIIGNSVCGNLEYALKAFRRLEGHKDYIFSPGIYSDLAEACIPNGDFKMALTLLDEMKSRGAKPAQRMLKACMHTFCKGRDVLNAERLMKEMFDNPDYNKPDTEFYYLLIAVKAPRFALPLYNEMKSHNIEPDELTQLLVAEKLFKSGQIDELLKFNDSEFDDTIRLEGGKIDIILSALSQREDYTDEFMRLFDLTIKKRVELEISTYKTGIKFAEDRGDMLKVAIYVKLLAKVAKGTLSGQELDKVLEYTNNLKKQHNII